MKLTSHFKHGHLADRRGKKGGVDDIIEHNYRPGLGFSGDASGKEPPCQCRRHKRCGFSPWVGKVPWRRAWQCISAFLLENPMDGEAWQATVHSVTKKQTQTKQLSTHSHVILLPFSELFGVYFL